MKTDILQVVAFYAKYRELLEVRQTYHGREYWFRGLLHPFVVRHIGNGQRVAIAKYNEMGMPYFWRTYNAQHLRGI